MDTERRLGGYKEETGWIHRGGWDRKRSRSGSLDLDLYKKRCESHNGDKKTLMRCCADFEASLRSILRFCISQRIFVRVIKIIVFSKQISLIAF